MTAKSLPDAACLPHLAKSEPAEGLGSRITLHTDAFGNFARDASVRRRGARAYWRRRGARACCERD